MNSINQIIKDHIIIPIILNQDKKFQELIQHMNLFNALLLILIIQSSNQESLIFKVHPLEGINIQTH